MEVAGWESARHSFGLWGGDWGLGAGKGKRRISCASTSWDNSLSEVPPPHPLWLLLLSVPLSGLDGLASSRRQPATSNVAAGDVGSGGEVGGELDGLWLGSSERRGHSECRRRGCGFGCCCGLDPVGPLDFSSLIGAFALFSCCCCFFCLAPHLPTADWTRPIDCG